MEIQPRVKVYIKINLEIDREKYVKATTKSF